MTGNPDIRSLNCRKQGDARFQNCPPLQRGRSGYSTKTCEDQVGTFKPCWDQVRVAPGAIIFRFWTGCVLSVSGHF